MRIPLTLRGTAVTCCTLLTFMFAALATASSPALAAMSAKPGKVTVHLNVAIKKLPVAAHSHASSYDRAKDFGDWIDQGGGCDTRAVVLKDESLTLTTQNSNCTIETGKWFSYYNATTYTRASSLQIDHTVPVENAWISGAWRWTQNTRIRYYNDLRDARTLVAVDTHDNESKGDHDPTAWIPTHGHCRYVRYWTAVKSRWHLSVTKAEKSALITLAGKCHNPLMTYTPAVVKYQ